METQFINGLKTLSKEELIDYIIDYYESGVKQANGREKSTGYMMPETGNIILTEMNRLKIGILAKTNGKAPTLDEIHKQAYLLMSNLNGMKINTNISEEKHETLMNSFFILQSMFNEYIKENE